MRILAVGLGQVGQLHLKNVRAILPDARLAVWRQRPETGNAIANLALTLPVDDWLHSPEAVLDWKPDAAIVANPASMHVETAQLLASNGVHLFVEKPISDRLDGVDLLIECCRQKGLVLMAGYDLRFSPDLQELREAVHTGKLIGRPLHLRAEVGQYLPDWRPGRDYRQSVSARRELGGGVVLELSHEIDYARWIMGEVVSVSAWTGKLSDLEIDVEDTAEITMWHEGGAVSHLHLDMVDRAAVRRCRVVGKEASIDCDLGSGMLRLEGQGSMDLRAPFSLTDPFRDEMARFLACVRGEAEPPVGGAAAKRVLEIALAAKRSAEEGRRVTV